MRPSRPLPLNVVILLVGLLGSGVSVLPSKSFLKIAGHKADNTIIVSLSSKSRSVCAGMCQINENCNGFNWLSTSSSTSECHIFQTSSSLKTSSQFDAYVLNDEPSNLILSPGGRFGTWGSPYMCETGSFVYGFAIWYDTYTGTGMTTDDCGVTGVEMACRTEEGVIKSSLVFNMGYADSSKRPTASCGTGILATGLQSRQGPTMDALDDDSLNNLQMKCSDGQSFLSYQVNDPGTWGSMTICFPGSYVCGMRVRSSSMSNADKTCIDDVSIHCCFP